jgi:antitoxin (DNA-binding transcriptional repressor) of toxin-antitoxin stability system
VATDEAEEEGGVPLFATEDGRPVARVVFLPPGNQFDAAPADLLR